MAVTPQIRKFTVARPPTHLKHDDSLRVPGSRLDEILSRLETKMQQDAGATAPHRMAPVGTVREYPNPASGGREALGSVASKG